MFLLYISCVKKLIIKKPTIMNLLKNFKKLFTALCILSSVFAMAQGNPQMIFPPNYWNPVGTTSTTALLTPAGSTSYGTTTFRSQYGALDMFGPPNMYADVSGNPLFFVVNGFVFNPKGYLIDTLIDTLYSVSGSGTYTRRIVAGGWSEVCIVPVPGNCNQYYIFTATDYGTSANATFDSHYQQPTNYVMKVCYKPSYAIIDVSIPTPGAPGGYGKNVTPGASPTGRKVVDLYSSTSTGQADLGGSDPASPYPGSVHYACTQLIGTGSSAYRFLYVFCYDELKVYKISASAPFLSFIHNYDISGWTHDFISDDYGQSILSELEINEDITNNKIHLALVGSQIAPAAGSQLIFADFTRSGTNAGLIDTSTYKIKKVCLSGCANSKEKITGVEFSPNGSYVYITRDTTAGYYSTVMSISYSTPTTTTSLSTDPAYSKSQIEAGIDGNLYLNYGGGQIDQITTPNSPGSITTTGLIGANSSYWPIYSNYYGSGGGMGTSIYYMPDQIDNETYGSQFFSPVACCLRYNSYDQFAYTSTGSTTQTWSGSSNPLNGGTGSTVTIGKELRIAAGYTVTIQNMTIKFTPEATFIVEGYTGGPNSAKLILKKCTLDVDTRCESKLWPGVRVWGDNTAGRGYTSQGYIVIDSMSVITNAWIGVELGYTSTLDPTFTSIAPVPSNGNNAGGGNIYANNSSFINNQRDVYFADYTSGTGGLCNMFSCNYTTNAYLLGGSSVKPLYHVQFNNYKPSAQIQGGNFSCLSTLTNTGYVYAAYGVYSLNSNYMIDQTSGNVRSKFSNFAYGVYAYNNGSNTATIYVKHSSFYDNKVGTYMGYISNATFASDTVKVWCNISGNASGLYLDNSTGYVVEDNYFTKGSGTYANNRFGNVTYNSGAYVNCIFRNTFDHLYKGSQAQYINYAYQTPTPHNAAGGLVYLCNKFNAGTMYGADIYVPATNGANVGGTYGCPTCTSGVAYQQGTGMSGSGGYPITAGNHFSHTGGSAWDFYIDTAGLAYNSNYYYYCASGICATSSLYPAKRKNLGAYVSSSDSVNCTTDPYSNNLRTSDPYTRMLNGAAAYKLIYDSLKTVINSLPVHSPQRFDLGVRMGNVFTSRHRLIDEAIHLLLDNGNDSSMVQVHKLMKEKALELPARSRVETGIAIHDSAMAVQALSEVANSEGQSNYVKLHTMLLQNMSKTPEQIMQDPSIVSQMQAMDKDSSDHTTYLKANILLRSVGLSDYVPYYQEGSPVSDNGNARLANIQSIVASESSLYSKPNPFSENAVIKAVIVEKTQNAYMVITDMIGNEISRYSLVQGENEITFNGSEMNQQILFCTLIIDGVKIQTNKMVLIK